MTAQAMLLGYGAAAGGADPYFASVVLLMHMDGSNGSTTFTDVKSHTMTANGNAQITTAQSVFGGASALFDGTGDYVSTPDSADWDFGTGDFTIEARMRFAGSVNGSVIASTYTSASSGWFFRVGNSGLMEFGSSGDTPIASVSWSPSANTWYAVACVRSAGNIYFFADGVQQGSAVANTENITGSTATLKVGSLNGTVSSLNGQIDELRITKGVARYTSNYTLPTSAFPDS